MQRWIPARLCHQQFFFLVEVNSAVAGLVEQLNDRMMRGLGTTQWALFKQLDQPGLLKLLSAPYEGAECGAAGLGSTTTSKSTSIATPCGTTCCAA